MRREISDLTSAIRDAGFLLETDEPLTTSEEANLTRLTWNLAAKLHSWKQKAHPVAECCHHALPEQVE
jgi:hypothetical protein